MDFDPVLQRSQEEISEFIEGVSALPGEPNDPTFFCPTRPAKGLGGGDTHSARTFSVDRIFSTVIPKIRQETLAEMVGTTRSRVSFFMNRISRKYEGARSDLSVNLDQRDLRSRSFVQSDCRRSRNLLWDKRTGKLQATKIPACHIRDANHARPQHSHRSSQLHTL